MISWKATREELRLMRLIALRAGAMAAKSGVDIGKTTDLVMDLNATHSNGCPLELAELLAAEDFDFCHDVWGIMRHIDRTNGQLRNCFLPRYAKSEVAA